jgi:hypothetical protein
MMMRRRFNVHQHQTEFSKAGQKRKKKTFLREAPPLFPSLQII